MTRIQKLSDVLLGLFAPRVTASAEATYYVYQCWQDSCPIGGGYWHRRQRCNDSWGCNQNWEFVGCCPTPN